MLTRIEIDGFKNLKKFSADFGPYTCIYGPNAIGKSNVFDAIAFLGHTASQPFYSAAQSLRGEHGEISDIFSNDNSQMTLSVEMILPKQFTDGYNREVKAEATYVRYSLTLQLNETPLAGTDNKAVRSISLVSEELVELSKEHADAFIPWAMAKPEFANSALYFPHSPRPKDPYITVADGHIRVYRAQQGYPTEIAMTDTVEHSAVSGFGDYDHPVIASVQRELASWMMLALEPSAMRSPSPGTGPKRINEHGGNLPATIYRLIQGSEGDAVLEDIVDDTRGLVDVREINVDFDESRQIYTLSAKVGEAPMLPARSLSDGTLRFLTLSTLVSDATSSSLICFEEPENGIYPERITAMYDLLHALGCDTSEAISDENPLRQIIVNTHSPAYVYSHRNAPDEILVGSTSPHTHGLRLSPLYDPDSWRMKTGRGATIPRHNLETFFEEIFPDASFNTGFSAYSSLNREG